MAAGLAERPHRECRTICLPISAEENGQIVDHAGSVRLWIENAVADMPELFPETI